MLKRFVYASVFVALAAMTLISVQSIILAQDPPPTLPPADAPPTFTPDPMLATLPPASDEAAAQESELGIAATEALPILLAARADMDLLARDRLGEGVTPEGWSGSSDTADPTLSVLIRVDLEILADALLGAGVRPDGWVGVVVSVPIAVARDIRHDLEYLADAVIGGPTIRPGGWRGDDPLYKCSRAAQNLLFLLERGYEFELTVDFNQPNYCAEVDAQANGYVESRLLQPETGSVADTDVIQPYVVESAFVVAFGDINARQRLGVVPVGTGFTPVGRSNNQFSNMMLISGTGFQAFVDYTYTPVTQDEFEDLSILAEGSVPTISCEADWCGR
jgi:hypothetical protein